MTNSSRLTSPLPSSSTSSSSSSISLRVTSYPTDFSARFTSPTEMLPLPSRSSFANTRWHCATSSTLMSASSSCFSAIASASSSTRLRRSATFLAFSNASTRLRSDSLNVMHSGMSLRFISARSSMSFPV